MYVKDVVAFLASFLCNDHCGMYNVGSGKAISFNDLAHNIFSVLKMDPVIEYFNMPKSLSLNYQNYTKACLKKVRALEDKQEISSLNTSLKDGIRDYVVHYLEKGCAKW